MTARHNAPRGATIYDEITPHGTPYRVVRIDLGATEILRLRLTAECRDHQGAVQRLSATQHIKPDIKGAVEPRDLASLLHILQERIVEGAAKYRWTIVRYVNPGYVKADSTIA